MTINLPSSVSGQTPGKPGGGITTTDDYAGPDVAYNLMVAQFPTDQATAVTRINSEYDPAIITTSTRTTTAVVNELGKCSGY